MGEVTTLIRAANAGDKQAVNSLFELLYDDLHRLAHARLRANAPNAFLETTGLLHETYVRFVKAGQLDVDDRRHFFAYATKVMRSIVVDAARRRNASQRGGGNPHVVLEDEAAGALPEGGDEILRVHEGLEDLNRIDEGLARLVEMRYFAGLQVREIAEVLGVTERTVERQWNKARAILFSVLR